VRASVGYLKKETEMRVRMFMEVELDDEILLKQLAGQLPAEHWDRELSAGMARQTEAYVRTLHSVKEAKVVFIPKLLSV
jgi:hypothetical protein